MRIMQRILLALTLILCVSGCSKLGEGVGRRPLIIVSDPPVFSEDEKTVLGKVSSEHPELARKIVGRNNELAAAIESYNKKSVEYNRDIMSQIGFNPEEIDKLYPKTP